MFNIIFGKQIIKRVKSITSPPVRLYKFLRKFTELRKLTKWWKRKICAIFQVFVAMATILKSKLQQKM